MPGVRALYEQPVRADACACVRCRTSDGYYLLGVDGSVYSFGTRQVLRRRARHLGRRHDAGPLVQPRSTRTTLGLPRALGPTAAPAPTASWCRYSITASGSWPRRTSATPITVPVRPRPPMQCTATPVPSSRCATTSAAARSTRSRSRSGSRRRVTAHLILQPDRGERARRGVVRRDVVREAHDVADPFGSEQRPVGPAGIRHARERDRCARDPVEVVGYAEVAEKAGVRADGQEAERHVHTIVNHARKVSPGATDGALPRPSASIGRGHRFDRGEVAARRARRAARTGRSGRTAARPCAVRRESENRRSVPSA